MSYRCQGCGEHVDGPMRRHVKRRPDGQIEKETPVCGPCLRKLTAGQPLPPPKKLIAPIDAVEPEHEGQFQFGGD